MQRYIKINDYYIEDQYTGQKLNQQECVNRLNQYEYELQKERESD